MRLAGVSGVATESTIRAGSQIDSSALPPFGDQWLAAVSQFLENPEELTPWQQRLPSHLLRAELVGPFLTHPAYRRIVDRLRSSPAGESDGRPACGAGARTASLIRSLG